MTGHIALFVAVVASVALSSAHGASLGHEAPPGKCCLPKQYSTFTSLMQTVGSESMIILDMQMDYDKQQQVMLNYTYNAAGSKTLNFRLLIDYVKGMEFIVPAAAPTQCYKVPLKLPMVRCIPDDAEYLGSSYMGPTGPGGLPYDGWRMKFPMHVANGPAVDLSYNIAVSKNGCVPLVETVSYPDPSLNQIFFFNGFQPTLKDPSLFVLPESCNE